MVGEENGEWSQPREERYVCAWRGVFNHLMVGPTYRPYQNTDSHLHSIVKRLGACITIDAALIRATVVDSQI